MGNFLYLYKAIDSYGTLSPSIPKREYLGNRMLSGIFCCLTVLPNAWIWNQFFESTLYSILFYFFLEVLIFIVVC